MKKLLNTLFVTSEDKYLALENENVVVWNGEERAAQYPLVMLEGIVSFSYKGASPAPAAWKTATCCSGAPNTARRIGTRTPAGSPGI